MPPSVPAMCLLVAFAAAGPLAGIADARAVDETTDLAVTLDQGKVLAKEIYLRFIVWVEAGYARRPALMIGLGGILLLPPLMLAGALLYRRKPGGPEAPDQTADAAPVASLGATARLEIDGARAIALPRGRDLVQIGRHEDNDICIEDTSVERYHAIIARSSERGFTITDVSGLDGPSLRINGAPCASGVLSHGDMVEVGTARLRFQAVP